MADFKDGVWEVRTDCEGVPIPQLEGGDDSRFGWGGHGSEP